MVVVGAADREHQAKRASVAPRALSDMASPPDPSRSSMAAMVMQQQTRFKDTMARFAHQTALTAQVPADAMPTRASAR